MVARSARERGGQIHGRGDRIHGGRMDPHRQLLRIKVPLAVAEGRSVGNEAQIQARLDCELFHFFCFLFDLSRRAPNRLGESSINCDLSYKAF